MYSSTTTPQYTSTRSGSAAWPGTGGYGFKRVVVVYSSATRTPTTWNHTKTHMCSCGHLLTSNTSFVRSFVRYSNMSFDAIFFDFLTCLMYGNNCFQSFQHRTKTRMCSCEDLLSNALSNAFNERVKVLLR